MGSDAPHLSQPSLGFSIEAVWEVDWVQQKINLVWQKEPSEVWLRSRV